MLRQHRLGVAVILIALFVLALVPAPSLAASRPRTAADRPAASLLSQLERWWNALMTGVESPAAERSAAWRKNGCGIDPNGLPLPCLPLCGGGLLNGTIQSLPPVGSGSP